MLVAACTRFLNQTESALFKSLGALEIDPETAACYSAGIRSIFSSFIRVQLRVADHLVTIQVGAIVIIKEDNVSSAVSEYCQASSWKHMVSYEWLLC